jgi:8-oxo-dGTP pyrophosphatase MutT (NUDIX family)
MAVPDFVVDLRRHIGHAPLWLPAVTAVIRRPTGSVEELLLIRRSDNRAWAPVTGIIEPGEQPAIAAQREALEETGVHISVNRLASVMADSLTIHVNGDQVYYLDHTFDCSWTGGEAYPADDESVDVAWVPASELPPMDPVLRRRIDVVLSGHPRAMFSV